MGLDISHIKLTTKPVNPAWFWYVGDWEFECNVPLEVYSKYITEMDDLEYKKSIAIVNDEEDYAKFIDAVGCDGYSQVFIGEQDDKMQRQISRFIVEHKLENLKVINSERGTGNSWPGAVNYNTISFAEPVKSRVIYYIDDIGYQRKGMNDLFYDTFKKHMFWGNKEDFELAYECIGGTWYVEHWGQEAVDSMKINFKKNFVEKFEFGKSLLNLSF